MTTSTAFGPLVSPAWLAAHLDEVTVLDASPADKRTPQTTIAGAAHFDIDGPLSDHSGPPHTMPDAAHFEREVRALGVNNASTIVVYDALGSWSSPRAWWMLRAMGHTRVAVLDGGLPAWLAEGLPTTPADDHPTPGDFTADPKPLFADQQATLAALADPAATVVDARSPERFAGTSPEPRPGLRAGHMPGSLNLPFTQVQRDGRMLPTAELKQIFDRYPTENFVFSCGSGVTACILALAATLAGRENLRVYDGSWSEWGLPDGPPVATG